jgi:ribosomal protein S18 acetylase RimI-like enzyme
VGGPSNHIRLAGAADAVHVGTLLDRFNREFGEPSPGPEALAERMRQLLDGGDTLVLLAGDGPNGLVVLRFRGSIWSESLECFLAELYVEPDLRGRGLGRALVEAALTEAKRRGADYIDLGTSDADATARALYESLGFTNREGGGSGSVNYYYGREL